MGCGASAAPALKNSAPAWQPIPDQFKSYEEVTDALRKAGLESSQLIVGVDFTGSNNVTGQHSFGGRCLHDIGHGTNPYERAMTVIAKVLADFDEDHLIPAYGFGDSRTQDTGIFSFQEDNVPCDGLDGVLAKYRKIVPRVDLAGPTSFAALIRQAIKLVQETCEYHILLIIADGQVNDQDKGVGGLSPTAAAIVEASNYALSIVMVGVGDGPWHQMEEFDDELPTRRFDNFQFVNLAAVWKQYPPEKRDSAFAVHALMEVPDQYKEIKRMNLLSRDACRRPLSALPTLLGPPRLVH